MTVQEIADKIEEDVLVELGLLILKLDELRSDEFYNCYKNRQPCSRKGERGCIFFKTIAICKILWYNK